MLKKSYHFNRRQFILGLVSAGFSSLLFANKAAPKKRELWVSAQGKSADSVGLSWIDQRKKETSSVLSSFRGHGISRHPLHESSVIMYGRRPNTSAIEVNLKSGTIDHVFHCKKERHLFGHGCFSANGQWLFTSETDLKTGKGKIAIRDALSYRQFAEYESYGIGPHEIKLMPDGKTLVIANGGILTHPTTGRKKLNLHSMDSSLTYINLDSGEKVDEVRVSESKASIRHLDVMANGTVVFAMQMQRAASGHHKTVALAGAHRRGEAVRLLQKPEALIYQMKDYAGSVIVSNQTRIGGWTSPKGNLAAFWRIDSGQFIGYHSLNDVCGISLTADQKFFVLSSSIGQLRFLDALTLKENRAMRIVSNNTHWDNHLISTLI